MTGQIRQTNRNGLVVAVLLAALGGAAWLGGPALTVSWVIGLGLSVAAVALGLLVVAGMISPRCNLVLRRLSSYGPPHQVAAALSVLIVSRLSASFCVIRTELFASSPVTVTTPFCSRLIEAAGHQRVSRASIVGLKLYLLAKRFMIGSKVAAGPRGEGE